MKGRRGIQRAFLNRCRPGRKLQRYKLDLRVRGERFPFHLSRLDCVSMDGKDEETRNIFTGYVLQHANEVEHGDAVDPILGESVLSCNAPQRREKEGKKNA